MKIKMPEEIIMSTAMLTALDNLEDFSLDNHISRTQNYSIALNAVEKDEGIDTEVLKRLLAVCVHDTTILKYTTNAINVILAILAKVKSGKYDPEPDLVPSALTVLSMLKTIATVNKVDSLMVICYDTLLLYPDKTLIAVAKAHEDVMEVFNLYCQPRVPLKIRLQACNLLHKLLQILPPEQKRPFVEKGVSVWFSKIIPTVMTLMSHTAPVNLMIMEVLEMLTEELLYINYDNNPQWLNILECICNTKQYPAMMINLLKAGNSVWNRVWIVFIKLLKNKITQSLNAVGTPINSMLPVVEAAFKLDVTNRCKAFECWDVLIDSFVTEINESNINKRLKLLIIPLRSNNAKAEETALAKFRCWWHLITAFQYKMDKFLDIVLVYFLHFCFGRHNATDKSQVVPGLISPNVKKQCNQALVDLVGHVNCDGCTELPKLKGKIISTKHLVDNWNHWIYSLTSVIMKSNSGYGLTKQQMTCLWKSYLMTIGELPENNIRKDLFAEILSIIDHLVQECKSNNQLLDIAFNILILSLFDEDTKIKQLFKSQDDPNDPVTRIMKIILHPCLHVYYSSLPSGVLVSKIKSFTKLILDETVCTTKHVIQHLLVALPINEYGFTFWHALAEAVYNQSDYKCTLVIRNLLLWPLKSVNSFTNKPASMTWYKTLDLMYPKLNKTDIDKEISTLLYSTEDTPANSVFFKLCVVLGLLKHTFSESNSTSEKEFNLLLNLTKSIDSYENYQPIFQIMVDRFVTILTIVSRSVNETVTALLLVSVKNVLNVLTQACKRQTDVGHLTTLIANLLKPMEALFAIDSYSQLVPAMTYHLLNCSSVLSEHASTRNIYLSVMKSILTKTSVTDSNYNKLKSSINDLENRLLKLETVPTPEKNVDNTKFTTPQTNEVPKRAKKKEPNIVNTVVENGEEYVVVKSNWKFNPRKLTENQKEKLQRKREDIPALYQDLSQSQDECRLVTWKPDSQDTTSSSKSESRTSKSGQVTETDAELLKNLPSTNVVPKIMENLFSEREKNTVKESVGKESTKDSTSKIDVSPASIKNTKSPRMALKDRVFRNVRNLIENAAVQKENKDLSDDPNKSDTNIKTPTQGKNNNTTNIVNSAPTLLSADRPSRVKRKPKKFEDLQLLTSKKSRNTLHDINLDKEDQYTDETSSSSSNNDTNKECKSTTSISTDNNDKDNHDNLQQSHDPVIYMDITNDDEDNIESMNGSNVTPCKDKAKTTSEMDVVMAENNKLVEQSNGQSNVAKPMVDGEPVSAVNIINNTKDPKSTPKSNRKTSEEITPKPPNKSSKDAIGSKEKTEATTPKSSKLSTPTTSKNILETATPKSSKPSRPISSKDKEVATPNSTKLPPLISSKGLEVATPTSFKLTTLITPKNTEIATPKSTKPSTPTTSKDMETVTPKSSKVGKEVSTPVTSRNLSEVLTSTVSANLNGNLASNGSDTNTGSPVKSFRNNKVLVIPTTSNKNVTSPSSVILVVPVPALSKDQTDVTSPRSSKVCIDISTPTVSNESKEISTPTILIDHKEVSSPTISKDSKVVPTPTISKDSKEVSTSMSKHSKEVSTPKASTDGMKISSAKTANKQNVKGVSTPKTQKDSKEVLKPKKSVIEEVSTPKTSIDPKVILTPTTSKEVAASKETKEIKEISTPKQSPKGDEQKSTTKKSTVKKSRIEKELAIDMVEGHPFLKMQPQKRLTRKAVESANTGRRKSLAEKLNKSKVDGNSSTKSEKKNKDKNKEIEKGSVSSVVVDESQEKESQPKNRSSLSDELPYSDDIIESSQDSTITTISVKSTRKTPKKVPVVCVEKLIASPANNSSDINNSQSILDSLNRIHKQPTAKDENKEDSILPLNKTVLDENSQDDLTENMDTEPIDEQAISEYVIIVEDNVPELTVAKDDSVIGPETQDIAEADTQPTDPKEFMDIDETQDNLPDILSSNLPDKLSADKVLETSVPTTRSIENEIQAVAPKSIETSNTANITTVTLSEAACAENTSGASSPFKDEAQRKQDFLNNTVEISPIKTMSPDRDKKSPSPETSSDYVVIRLSSPVHSNGEPFEKCDSPEVFTEDKVSPDKRDQSPPRVEISVTSTSPSSSLSLKKNRPQVRSGGRAAQMLGLCVPDKVQAIVNPERIEAEEVKKGSATNTPARRNLRMLYNSASENTENSNSANENDDNENFLKFRRSLPAVDSSPSGPILKRKLAEITDDATVSPASKRKRVSFHDPPVSTTVSVQKYIEPGGVRSPQNSAHKRLERQLRQYTPVKSPKRLDNVFKLDTVLTKTVESFSENEIVAIVDDTQPLSLDETPEVEIVRASELNDSDPICPDLLDCKDPIQNIAEELSSAAMKTLLIKELEGKIETVGDLAKMTELEVNRLCIKAPKVKVAKKVLTDYAAKKADNLQPEVTITLDDIPFDEPLTEAEVKGIDIEIQTDKNASMEVDVQTMEVPTSISSVQTDTVPTAHTSIQTKESGSKSTNDVIKTCLSERPDFVRQLGKQLKESSIQKLSGKLPMSAVVDVLMKKITPSDTKEVLNRLLEQKCSSLNDRSKELPFIRDYLHGRFDSKDLILLCSELLKLVYDRTA